MIIDSCDSRREPARSPHDGLVGPLKIVRTLDGHPAVTQRDFMMSLSDDKQANVIVAFNTTSRYLDNILNINNVYFDYMVSQIYHLQLQRNKANTSDTEAAFLDLHLSVSNDKFMINVMTLI